MSRSGKKKLSAKSSRLVSVRNSTPKKSQETPRVPGAETARKGSRGERRKHLDERLRLLYQRAVLIEDELRKLDEDRFYRVCIFGSARIKPDTKQYGDVFELARYL